MNWDYKSNVSDAEFNKALGNLQTAILKKDTPEEWAKLTSNVLVTVGKLAVAQLGFGPATILIEQIFGDDNADVLVALLKLLGSNNEDT